VGHVFWDIGLENWYEVFRVKRDSYVFLLMRYIGKGKKILVLLTGYQGITR